jgi:Ice-binding-like/Bacterial Ig-like domain
MSTASAVPAATFVNLGAAASYSVLGGTGVANTGDGTVLAGDLGLSPIGAIAGFPPGTLGGTTHDKDAAAGTAQSARSTAYSQAAGEPSTTTFSGDLAGVTFHPGVHTSAAAVTNTGTMTLDADGDSSAVFVFQVGAALSSAASSKVVLTNGALANNVFWQVVGAVSLGAGASDVGTFLAAGAITLGDGASVKGRLLTPGTVAMTNSPVTQPIDDLTAPVVTIAGGPTPFTNDTTPAITGTTDEPAGRPVTVTVGGQTLTATVDAGHGWAVSANALTPGSHAVEASSTDASQNTGTATQVLTVDVTVPVVSLNGGVRRSTRDVTPTISGSTSAPADTLLTVIVGGQNLNTTVGLGGTWTVQAAALSEFSYTVVASVADAAGNTGTAYQSLTVDVTVPVLTIKGGATRSTVDTSPWITGTTGEQAGTKVRVSIGGQALKATVLAGGTWGVSARALVHTGPHKVVASITDAAGNRRTVTQILTITHR